MFKYQFYIKNNNKFSINRSEKIISFLIEIILFLVLAYDNNKYSSGWIMTLKSEYSAQLVKPSPKWDCIVSISWLTFFNL